MNKQTSKSLINPVKIGSVKSVVNPVYNEESANNTCSKILDMFVRLSNYIESIKILFYEYSLGNIDMVASILTLQTFETISVNFSRMAVSEKKYPKYEQLRRNYVYAITGLYQSLLQNLKMNECKSSLDAALNKASILNDPEKLKAYINSFKSVIFPDTSVQIIPAKIKPEYLEYIKLYGYPESNVFDPNKLGEIIVHLKNSDII